eukprot:2793203-Rhodomonas_salina.1
MHGSLNSPRHFLPHAPPMVGIRRYQSGRIWYNKQYGYLQSSRTYQGGPISPEKFVPGRLRPRCVLKVGSIRMLQPVGNGVGSLPEAGVVA